MLAAVVAAGCAKEAQQDGKSGNALAAGSRSAIPGSFDKLPDNATIISVDGRKLTKGEFSKWIALRQTMVSRTIQGGGKIGLEQLDFIKRQMLSSVTNDFPREVAIAGYAKSRRITASTNDIWRCRQGFLAASRLSGKPWKKALAAFPKELQDTIEGRVAAEAISFAVADRWQKENKIAASQDEIDKIYGKYLEYNKTCAASNATVWATASNIWKKAVSGADFRELQDKYDQDEYKSGDGEWGTFTPAGFTDEPELWKLCRHMRPGWISPPVEGDNGLMILKVLSLDDGDGDTAAADYTPSPDASIKLARIFLHLPLFIEETGKEEFAKEVQNAKTLSEYNKFAASLVSKAKIEFPCGTRIFEPPKPAAKGMPVLPAGAVKGNP